MEHVIAAPHGGIVRRSPWRRATWCAKVSRSSSSRKPRWRAAPSRPRRSGPRTTSATTCGRAIERHALTLDENRPEAVARRRKTGYRMPRENIDAAGRSRLVQRILAAGRRAAAPAALDGGAAQEHARRWRGRRHRARSTATCSTRPARAPRWCTTTTPCWPARRAIATTTSRTACSSWRTASACRWCCSARAAAAGRARTISARASPSIRTTFTTFSQLSRAWCR